MYALFGSPRTSLIFLFLFDNCVSLASLLPCDEILFVRLLFTFGKWGEMDLGWVTYMKWNFDPLSVSICAGVACVRLCEALCRCGSKVL